MSHYRCLIGVFNERRTELLSQELLDLRDATIGSPAIIALLDAGHLPESLPVLLLKETDQDHQNVAIIINEYIVQLAFGDAVLRHRGELGPDYYVPNGPLEELKGIKTSWTVVFKHVERELKPGGLFADDPAWQKDYIKGKTWRSRLEAVLPQLDAKLVSSLIRVCDGQLN